MMARSIQKVFDFKLFLANIGANVAHEQMQEV
jgi:hypothetical protein